jgi:hypothetical protein
MTEQTQSQISNNPADTQWISSFLGHYENRELGRLPLLKKGSQYWAQTDRWEGCHGAGAAANQFYTHGRVSRCPKNIRF